MRNTIPLVLMLLLLIPCIWAQETEPTIDPACATDVVTPDSPRPSHPVGSNECPYWYVPANVTPPELIEHPEAVYTGKGFFPGEAPSVMVVALVSTEGVPYRISVARASAEGPGLDQMAAEAIRKWRWNPATRDGRPLAVMIKPIQLKFKLDGSSAEPHVKPPAAANVSQTKFRDVDSAKYPLTIFVGGGSLGIEGEGYRVTRSAHLVSPSQGVFLLVTCAGTNKGCSIPEPGNYPARWVAADRGLEILTRVVDEDEWRAVHYDVKLDTERPKASVVVHKNEHE